MRLVYDGSCRTCRELARWALAHDRTGQLVVSPYQEPGVLEACHLSPAEAAREVWLIEESGERLGGPRAINHLLSRQGGMWSAIARLFMLPLVSRLEAPVYHWFSEHRHGFDRLWRLRREDERMDGPRLP
ncbi:MAG TPA: DCC1-like thiol-disulfide oxidoreductase family protein [Stenomitos sp.]